MVQRSGRLFMFLSALLLCLPAIAAAQAVGGIPLPPAPERPYPGGEALLKQYADLRAQLLPLISASFSPVRKKSSGALNNYFGAIKGSFWCDGKPGPAEARFNVGKRGREVALIRADSPVCNGGTAEAFVFVLYHNGKWWAGKSRVQKGIIMPVPLERGLAGETEVPYTTFGDSEHDNYFLGPSQFGFYDFLIDARGNIAVPIPGRDQIHLASGGWLSEGVYLWARSEKGEDAFRHDDHIYRVLVSDDASYAVAGPFSMPDPTNAGGFDTSSAAFSGWLKVGLDKETGIGPSGFYYGYFSRLGLKQIPNENEIVPSPGLLAKYGPQIASCPGLPPIPAGWIPFAASCEAAHNKVSMYFPDGQLRIVYRQGQSPVYQKFSTSHTGPVEEIHAKAFTADSVPVPIGAAEIWRNGAVAGQKTYPENARPRSAGKMLPEAIAAAQKNQHSWDTYFANFVAKDRAAEEARSARRTEAHARDAEQLTHERFAAEDARREASNHTFLAELSNALDKQFPDPEKVRAEQQRQMEMIAHYQYSKEHPSSGSSRSSGSASSSSGSSTGSASYADGGSIQISAPPASSGNGKTLYFYCVTLGSKDSNYYSSVFGQPQDKALAQAAEVGYGNSFSSYIGGRHDADAHITNCLGPYRSPREAEDELNNDAQSDRSKGKNVVFTPWRYSGD